MPALQIPAASTGKRQPFDPRQAAAFAQLSKLPAFHPAALKLLNIPADSESPMSAVEEVFRSDPALTADLLRVANSAEFGQRSRIETIRHALTYLGLERVRSLATTVAFRFYIRNSPQTRHMHTVWCHSIATAVIADTIGFLCDAPGMYTAGLLHDLGRLGLLLSAGKPYAQALGQEFASIAEANVLEKVLFGMTHCEAGAVMSRQWAFPMSLRTSMADHHKGAAKCPPGQLTVVQRACLVADSLGFAEVARLDLRPVEDPLMERQEMAPARLRDQITAQIAAFEG